jgi:hypothetical protein
MKHAEIPNKYPNCVIGNARRKFEARGFVDGEINATRINLIINARKRYKKSSYWKRTYNQLYPLLTKNGQIACDKLLKDI